MQASLSENDQLHSLLLSADAELTTLDATCSQIRDHLSDLTSGSLEDSAGEPLSESERNSLEVA